MRALAGAIGVFCALAWNANAAANCNIDLQFIGEHSLPAETRVGADAFGGISGIDYHRGEDLWYLVSDDRSRNVLARLFTARFHYTAENVVSVELHASHRLQSPAAIDAEAIRVEPLGGSLMVAGEGDVTLGYGAWLQRITIEAQLLEALRLPAVFITSEQRGPRPNKSIEGLTFAPSGRTFWIALETAMLQDGPTATPDRRSDVRLTHMTPAGVAIAQYVYRTETADRHGPGESSDNGISEILALGAAELLVLERSGVKTSAGFRFHNRLYCASLAGATDVSAFESLAGRPYRVLEKRRVLDFDTLPQDAGNLEAMSWGSALAGGRRSLVFASDNNFFAGEPTRLLFFSVQPRAAQKRARTERVNVRGAPMK